MNSGKEQDRNSSHISTDLSVFLQLDRHNYNTSTLTNAIVLEMQLPTCWIVMCCNNRKLAG